MMSSAVRLLAAAVPLGLVLSIATAPASVRLVITPEAPAPGAIVRLVLEDEPGGSASALAVRGDMAGEPLHFAQTSPGIWRAIGAVPVDASDSVVARAIVTRSSGRVDTAHASVSVPRLAPTRPPSTLAVDSRFTQPLDAATQARIARENARARALGREAHTTPPLWTEPFVHPRESRVTSGFGSGRTFNGRVSSRHLGVDFAGGVGAPVLAANRGVVALVDTFFLAGNVVYVDHGGGLVTGYFHLSRSLVAAGDTVERGQRIGLVGASGRVTGPHLHWSARYGTLTVNPLDLVELGPRY